MSCDTCRDAVSDGLDGRPSAVDPSDVDAHLDECADCRSFADGAHAVRRTLGMSAAPSPGTGPVDTDRLVRSVIDADRSGRSPVVRWLLTLVAIQIAVLAIPDFLSLAGEEHSLRHLGAFSLAYAAGLLLVVARPARARTMLSVSMVLLVALMATTTIDVVQGRIPVASEVPHLLEMCSAWFLWMLTRSDEPGSTEHDAGDGDDARAAVLRLVGREPEVGTGTE